MVARSLGFIKVGIGDAAVAVKDKAVAGAEAVGDAAGTAYNKTKETAAEAAEAAGMISLD